MLKKIISGGQTGVDQAALEVAIDLGFEYGGYCPKGRFNENGEISNKYSKLIEVDGFFESPQENYDTRTKFNITHSDGTLIIWPSLAPLPYIQDGTRLTQREVLHQGKPSYVLDYPLIWRKTCINVWNGLKRIILKL